jgi:hypothetical protein
MALVPAILWSGLICKTVLSTNTSNKETSLYETLNTRCCDHHLRHVCADLRGATGTRTRRADDA